MISQRIRISISEAQTASKSSEFASQQAYLFKKKKITEYLPSTGGVQALVKRVHVTIGAVEAIAVASNQRTQLEKSFALADMVLPVRMI